MLKELLDTIGEHFPLGKRVSQEQGEKALYVIRRLFPKNKMFLGGSVAIVGAGNDVDIVMRGCEEDVLLAKSEGFVKGGEVYEGSPFTSLRYNNINLIIIFDNKDFKGFRLANEVCINLRGELDMDKHMRKILHEAIRNAY